MAYNDVYRRQVELLIRILPHVGSERCFALKGGIAINLFIRDMPRLSVDIDLTYLPIADHPTSLAGINAALKRIAESIHHSDNSIQITKSAPRTQNEITRLIVRARDKTQIKIEVTPVSSRHRDKRRDCEKAATSHPYIKRESLQNVGEAKAPHLPDTVLTIPLNQHATFF